MKKSRLFLAAILALCTLAGIFALNAVSAAQRAGIAAELRDEYEYLEDNFGVCPVTLKSISERTNGGWAYPYSALVLVEAEGDRADSWKLRLGFGERAEGLKTSHSYYELRVLDIVGEKGETGLEEGRSFMLEGRDLASVIFPGGRYLLFVYEAAGEVNGVSVFGTEEFVGFWYTDEGRVMSMFRDELLDSFSGMTLAEFKRSIAPTLRKSGW